MTEDRCTVDVGNSSIGVGWWQDGQLAVERLRDPRQAASRLRGLAAVISVSPLRLEALIGALAPGQAGRTQVLTRPPEDLGAGELLASAGADRIAAALAVRPGPAVVVDAGTAVTVDIIDARGRYLGGFIAPGPAASALGVASHAAQLPRLPGGRVPLVHGAGTSQALAAGLWGMAVGGVDRLVEAALAALPRSPAPRLVCTGGWGADWAADTRHGDVRVDPDLVHRG
ncbi:MAG TPA: type III pantothenate kinase, partial [Planctomycetota bacterium]|nr:type III pantothenate kinase [Planctomycetota bacterium]